ncbi:GGDEF domain-containing protein [Marinomonas rhizomae]|uniref:diguanylate cyclase n=1 Tax=Marinomonas rhizomae TaxID=491948 RepID=A0A366IY16_9GAMM|nr:GGDEF domain-containing protein [Marinomonas rhizomae]RBP79572.1 diguanylate cyclase (GGDEF)-like protein [Marinomonas rhizomae]RNF71573.1 GGDEF domain-containing protein [Marinomonas rhizomae]
MFNWLNVSMTRKISGLSFVLLSFLFVVIVYSAYQSQRIYKEMHEVAEIDVPLSEVMADIEMLQLKQHLLMESIRQQGDVFFSDQSLQEKSIEGFDRFSAQLAAQLDKSTEILRTGLGFGSIRIKLLDHRSLIQHINLLHQHRIKFDHLVDDFLKQGKQGFSTSWPMLELQDKGLDTQTDELLRKIDQLTINVSAAVESQERHFVVMNAVLGISAFGIGTYLTLYIIITFRKRIWSLRGQIESLHRSIVVEHDKASVNHKGLDELDELETDLKVLVRQFSKEMSNRHKVEAQLIELATRDKLTGAFNRHKWDELIKDELALANRGHHFSLILLDVDHFKKINDTYGHDVGDNVLKLLVNTLRKRLREIDVLFRVGGEEFAVLVKDTNLEGAGMLAEQLRKKVEALNENGMPPFTISLGVTDYQDSDDQSRIVKRADVLLYEAKGAGRNTVVIG